MGETNPVATPGNPPVTGQTSDANNGSTSIPPEATYTKVDLEKYASDALTEQGRRHKAEVSTLKSRLDELSDIKDDRESLQQRISELSSKDPEVFNLVKKEAELRDREKKLVSDTRLHEARIKKADDYERDVSITKIVEEFEGGDFDKLKGLCETFNSSSEEQIRRAAETLWTKKINLPPGTPPVPPVTTPQAPPSQPYSGMTSGGSEPLPTSAKGKIKAGWDELHTT